MSPPSLLGECSMLIGHRIHVTETIAWTTWAWQTLQTRSKDSSTMSTFIMGRYDCRWFINHHNICLLNCGYLESSHCNQDDLFPSGWALGQGTDPYGLPFLTVSLAVVAAITMLQQLSTLKKSNLQFQIIHFLSVHHQQVPHGSLESRSIYHEGFHIFQVANKISIKQ